MLNKYRSEIRLPLDATFADSLPNLSGFEQQQGASLTSTTKESYRLEELLKGCQLTKLHEETDFGADVGREFLE